MITRRPRGRGGGGVSASFWFMPPGRCPRAPDARPAKLLSPDVRMKFGGQDAKQDDMIVAHFDKRVAMVVCSHMQVLIPVARAFELKGIHSGRKVGDHGIRSTGKHEMIGAFEASHGLPTASGCDQNIVLGATLKCVIARRTNDKLWLRLGSSFLVIPARRCRCVDHRKRMRRLLHMVDVGIPHHDVGRVTFSSIIF